MTAPPAPASCRRISRCTRLKRVDGRRTGKQYLMGEAFSVATPYLLTVTNWAPRVGFDIAHLANLAAFCQRMAAWPRRGRLNTST